MVTAKAKAVVKIKTAPAIKLDDNNFFSSKAHTLANLRGYELLHLIHAPVDESNSLAIQQDQLLLGWIFASLSPGILSQEAACSTSHDIWTVLQKLFNTKSRSRKLQLRHELSYMKKRGLSINQYLAALSKKADEVRDANIYIEDEELALFALDGLDSSYDAFVIAITATAGDLSFSEFKGLLKAHEKRSLRELALPLPFANLIQNNQNQRNLGPSIPPSFDTSSVIYQICSKRGHTTIICFNMHNETRYPTPILRIG